MPPLFFISIHIGAKVSQGGSVLQRSITLVLEEVDDMRHKLTANVTVKISRDVNGWLFPHAGQAIIIAAGEVPKNFYSKANAGSLNGVDQGAGNKKMICETLCLFIADIFRAGAVMAKDDVTEFTGQGALDKNLGQLLIISHDIIGFTVLDVYL